MNRTSKNKLLTTEMDFWRTSRGVSRLERKRNTHIRKDMEVEKDRINRAKTTCMVWTCQYDDQKEFKN